MKRKKRKKINYKLLLFLFIIIICIVFVTFYLNNKLVVDIKQNIEVKENDILYYNDLISNIKNGHLKDNILIDTSKSGSYEVKLIIVDNNNKEIEYKVTINIIDSLGPTISFSEKLTTEVGTKIDLLKGVSAKDNDKDVKVDVEGDYDFDKVGEYRLYYVAKDDSNNITKEEFTLIVKEKKSSSQTQTGVVEHTKEDGIFTTSKGFKGEVKNGITYIDGLMIANKTYALPSTYNPGFNSEVSKNADVMLNAAKLEGLNIYIVSGFRSYSTQSRIYNNYVKNDGKVNADTYSARPGHSEHQTGLAFDVCMDGYACVNSGFDNTPPAKWLAANAYKYGFVLRYPKGKTNETGYMYESWHFRYVGVELATKLYNNGDWSTLEDYFGITSEYDY